MPEGPAETETEKTEKESDTQQFYNRSYSLSAGLLLSVSTKEINFYPVTFLDFFLRPFETRNRQGTSLLCRKNYFFGYIRAPISEKLDLVVRRHYRFEKLQYLVDTHLKNADADFRHRT